MKSVMVNQFKSLPNVEFLRNTFDRSFGYLTTLDAGLLYPVFYDEVVPGQTKRLKSSFFGRINTLIVPSYTNIYLDFHLWYVPNRLTWSNWNAFMGETFNPYGGSKVNPADYLNPIVNAPTGGFPRYSLPDYMTVPPAVEGLHLDAKYLRAYNLIWNSFYRSETLQDPVDVPTGDGPDDFETYYTYGKNADGSTRYLLPRGKRFDYFTSCLPTPQRGESVYLPLGQTAPVWYNPDYVADKLGSVLSGSDAINAEVSTSYLKTERAMQNTEIYADLTRTAGLTVQAFRNLVALNQFLERENRYGDRIQELIYGHFGVVAPDYRLQLPEFLGGTTIRLNVSQVPQTSASSTDETPQGNLAAYGILAHSGSGFYRSFVEHGVIIGLVSLRADLQYQQGVDRMLTRRKREDYLWPEFAGISDQEVYNREIYADGTADDDGIFGYQERYGEYRFHNSYVTGKMRSSDPQSLDVWHTAQYFENRPTLSAQYIEENPPIDRIIAVQDEPQFTLDCFFDYKDTSPLPLYGIPGLQRL
ncbi:major capsid protein [Sigmofec virus UA08Rod_5746]|uniref:Major capsid protein n=1 Tax=Sigmofec virus UA08Rod_5746 TaxID=2929439 RepID=A0A976N0N2_9VIRU|nr:major capsid protein [Sigmofec virus UA08Rod_5746]